MNAIPLSRLALGIIVLLAGTTTVASCTTEVVRTTPAVAEAGATDEQPTEPDDLEPAAPGAADASTDAGPIGTLGEKGLKTVDVAVTVGGRFSCSATCRAAGGTCKGGLQGAIGYLERRRNDGSGTFGHQLDDCDGEEPYATANSTLTRMHCYCSDMPVPPTVRVRKAEGLHTCKTVCVSWSLACDEKGVHLAYPDERESTSQSLAGCGALPEASTHHYTCACARN